MPSLHSQHADCLSILQDTFAIALPSPAKCSPILENLNFGSLLQTKHLNKEPSRRWRFLLSHQIKGEDGFLTSVKCF